MPLFLHELSHLVLSLLVGLVIWKKWYKHTSVFIAVFIGGVFIDFDHLIDYFLAFGTKFNLTYFLKGYQFLKSDKIYVLFHSWELVIIIFLMFLFFMNFKKVITLQTLLLAFSLSLFLHLSVDVFTNNIQAQSYFLTYRIYNNFELKTMVTNEHYLEHLKQKKLTIYH